MSSYDDIISVIKEALSSDIKKGEPLTTGVKPKGPESSRETVTDKAAKVPSISGLAAPGNVAGPGRPKGSVSETAPTAPQAKGSATAQGQEIVYISKKDYPEAPRGTIGSTPNSWKVPAGIGRILQAKDDGVTEQKTTKDEASAFNKKSKPREVVVAHLSQGKIANIETTSADGNATDTYKITIQGNGSGIMKPPTTHLNLSYEETREAITSADELEGWQWNDTIGLFSRKVTKQLKTNSMDLWGAGAGTLDHKKSPEREVAGHLTAQLHGLNNVPVTVLRNEGGKTNSVQEWKEGVSSFSKFKKKHDKGNTAYYDINVLEKAVPKSKHKELHQAIMDTAVHDIITNANDRHGLNFMIEDESNKIVLIDHGLSFGLSMHGHRNYFLSSCFSPKTKIKMSEELKTRLNNLTFSDYKRSMPGLADWEVGQTFLRARYVTWLQDNHGEIDPQKFSHTISKVDGSNFSTGDQSSWACGDGFGEKAVDMEMQKRKELGLLPHQLFESWSKAFLDQAVKDTKHPDHNDAKTISDIGVFMELGFIGNHGSDEAYRAKGLHKKYEEAIVPSFAIPQKITAKTKGYTPMSDTAGTLIPGSPKDSSSVMFVDESDSEAKPVK